MTMFMPPRREPPRFRQLATNASETIRSLLLQMPLELQILGIRISIADVAADTERYLRQRQIGMPTVAVELRIGNGPEEGQVVSVLVDFDADESGEGMDLNTPSAVSMSGIALHQIDSEEAEELFVERAGETLAIRAMAATSGFGAAANVEVITNRSGDQIVYSKGYFYSTATGFGLSTPARNTLPAGRYDFGVRAGFSTTQWNGVLYDVPHPTPIRVPLP